MLLFEFVHFSSYISGDEMPKSMTEIELLRILAQRAEMGPAEKRCGEELRGRAAGKSHGEELRRSATVKRYGECPGEEPQGSAA